MSGKYEATFHPEGQIAPLSAPESTETASEPVRALPDTQPAGEALVQQIAEALRSSPNGPHLWLPGPTDLAPSFARAVLPLVEAQVAPLRDEVTKFRDQWEVEVEHCHALGKRVKREVRAREAAESALRQVRELADNARRHAGGSFTAQVDVLSIERALARVGAADTQPEGAGEVERLWFVDKATREPCPTLGNRLCTITDRDHRHVDGRTPTAGGKVDTAPQGGTYAVYVGPRLATTAYDAARFRLGELETPMGWRLGEVIARLVLDSGAVIPADTAPESGEGR